MEIKELDKQIKSGTLGSLYFFYGEEQFLLENKIKSIKKSLLDPDFADLNYTLLDDKKLSVQSLSGELMSVPVMAEKKLIVVKNSGIFNNSKLNDFKAVCELLEDIPDYLCVIFTEKEFDKKKEKNLDTLKKYGQIVKFETLSPVQLERWLDKMFADNQKSILPRDAGTMIRLCGQSMAALYNEFNKVLSYVGERQKVTEEDILAVVSKSTETRIFEVIDSIASGKSQRVFDELGELRASGEDPSKVLTLLAARLSDLLMVKQLAMEKMSSSKISAYFEPKKPSFVVDKLIEQSRKFSESYLAKMTLLGPYYTAEVRSGRLDKWVALEMYASGLVERV